MGDRTYSIGMKALLATKIAISLIVFIFLHSAADAHVEQSKELSGIGIGEKLGQFIPLDLTFHDENGSPVTLRQLIHTPTILALVYFHCPNVCSLLLQNLADALNRLPAEPGKEYEVLSISFDEREKPALALQKKKTYLQMIQKPFPEEAWRFLTGDKENIRKLTDTVGFNFRRVGKDFEHPVTLIILAPDGKIIRYMYGADPLPFDLRLALFEASQGRIGPTIAKVVRFCFSYDPKAKKLVFNVLKVTGTVTLVFALSFVVFLLFKGRKQHPKEE
ncbi:MAG TPA: SCO family protein [Thermodesulfobacteriota bacterium]|nr:SCO family protein [Thermodesulfobacteriota bacterium]